MAVWKDISIYSQDEPVEGRKPRVLEYATKRLSVRVHRHIHYPPDSWLVSCHTLGMTNVELGNKDLEKAKAEALDFLRVYAEALVKELS